MAITLRCALRQRNVLHPSILLSVGYVPFLFGMLVTRFDAFSGQLIVLSSTPSMSSKQKTQSQAAQKLTDHAVYQYNSTIAQERTVRRRIKSHCKNHNVIVVQIPSLPPSPPVQIMSKRHASKGSPPPYVQRTLPIARTFNDEHGEPS